MHLTTLSESAQGWTEVGPIGRCIDIGGDTYHHLVTSQNMLGCTLNSYDPQACAAQCGCYYGKINSLSVLRGVDYLEDRFGGIYCLCLHDSNFDCATVTNGHGVCDVFIVLCL
jgi:hypothetical protein